MNHTYKTLHLRLDNGDLLDWDGRDFLPTPKWGAKELVGRIELEIAIDLAADSYPRDCFVVKSGQIAPNGDQIETVEPVEPATAEDLFSPISKAALYAALKPN